MSKQNTAMNEFTGDNMSTGHVSDAYRDGHSLVFGDKVRERYDKYVAYHLKENTPYMDFEGFKRERNQEPRWLTHVWDGRND